MIGQYILLTGILWQLCLTDGACPDGWDSKVSGCYKFQDLTLIAPDWSNVPTYGEAKVICADMGAKLIVFNSQDEMANVGNTYASERMGVELGSPFNFWVGCTDAGVEGTFECEDSTQLPLNSDLWQTAYPKSSVGGGGIEDCLYYLPNNGGLEDTDCNAPYNAFALCEVDPLPEETTPEATTPEATTPPPQQSYNKNPSGFYAMAKDTNGNPRSDYCLSADPMKIISGVKDKIHCAGECGKEENCASFNYKGNDCELYDSTGMLTDQDGCLHYVRL
nr:uncharacterized protein LOC129272580 [Lytechinus pictus]